MCSKEEMILAYSIKIAMQKLKEGRGFGDCHSRILCMVLLYQCTVKACKKKNTGVAGVFHRQVIGIAIVTIMII